MANRGEIACRVIRTLHRLGVDAVAVHSDADHDALHVRRADRAVRIGEGPAPLSYLNPAAVVEAARSADVDAVHPGYGFLAESPRFARAVVDAGLVWIGPPPEVLGVTGDKVAARSAFAATGFPVLPGAGPLTAADHALAAAEEVGYPVMVKAVMGGGGIGMGVAEDPETLPAVVEGASTRGERFFADAGVYLERYVPGARHIEIQVLFGPHGTGLHLYERECSVQRRHQKVLEEAPSPAVDEALLSRMAEAALRSMSAIGYVGAGTVECLLAPDGSFSFLEVNARLQVEHPVTEETCDVDLVEEQLWIAAGEAPSLQDPPPRSGHAVECRVYAEDPDRFLPSPGRIDRLVLGEGVRWDVGYEEGTEVPVHYDPLIGKAVAWGEDRAAALAAMRGALETTLIEGVKTNVATHLRVLSDERFVEGRYDTSLLGA